MQKKSIIVSEHENKQSIIFISDCRSFLEIYEVVLLTLVLFYFIQSTVELYKKVQIQRKSRLIKASRACTIPIYITSNLIEIKCPWTFKKYLVIMMRHMYIQNLLPMWFKSLCCIRKNLNVLHYISHFRPIYRHYEFRCTFRLRLFGTEFVGVNSPLHQTLILNIM